jgi:hypothetical protein
MPQLDKFAYAPQVFWLVLIFFAVYTLVLRSGLTTLYKVLVFRKKFLGILHTATSSLIFETTLVRLFTIKFVSTFLQSRNNVEFVSRFLESSLIEKKLSYEVLRNVRYNLVFLSISPRFVGIKLGLIPTSKRYASLKFV